jgi:hypothetical protein
MMDLDYSALRPVAAFVKVAEIYEMQVIVLYELEGTKAESRSTGFCAVVASCNCRRESLGLSATYLLHKWHNPVCLTSDVIK